jgi:hypothetical protein
MRDKISHCLVASVEFFLGRVHHFTGSLLRGHRTILSKIIFARLTASATALNTRGDGLQMCSSRASLTAAISEAAMTSVEAKRSVLRRSSSWAFARFISPMSYSRKSTATTVS